MMLQGSLPVVLARCALVVALLSHGQISVAAPSGARAGVQKPLEADESESPTMLPNEPAFPEDGSVHVQVTLVGPAAQATDFSGLVEEWLAANGISHVIREASSLALDDIKQARGSGPPVRIWVVVSSSKMMHIYLAEPEERRYLVRNVPLPNGLDELGRERAAQVVLSSALAFMERRAASSLDDVERALGAQAGAPMSVRPALGSGGARSRSEQSRPESRPIAFAYGLGASYALSYPTEPVHGPGGLLFTQWSGPPWSLRVLLRGQYHWQKTIETERIRVAERGAALTLGGALLKELGPAWQLHLELGAGMDSVLLMPEALSGSDVEPRGPNHDTRPFVAGMLGVAWHTEHLELDLLFGCDAYSLTTRYVVHGPDGMTREFTRARLQPGLRLDVIWGNELVTQRER